MPQVPIIDKEVGVAPLPSQGYSSRISAPRLNVPQANSNIEAVGRGQQDLLQAVNNLAVTAKQRGDQIAIIDAQRQLDEYEAGFLNNMASTKGKSAFSMPEAFEADFAMKAKNIGDSLANGSQKEAFAKMAGDRRLTMLKNVHRHVRSEMDSYAEAQTTAAVESGINRATTYWNNPQMVEASIRNSQAAAEAYYKMQGMPEEFIKNKKLEIGSKARLGVMNRMADNSPQEAIKFYESNADQMTSKDLLSAQNLLKPVQRKVDAMNIFSEVTAATKPPVGQDQAINFVMHNLEGGDKTVPDGKGIAKYGINSAANPDIDVENLTEEEAAAVYKERYWDKMSIDDLPPQMQLVAFDTAVSHGRKKAGELIKEAGNDPMKLLALRKEEYERLITQKPEEYAKNKDGWDRRLRTLAGAMSAMQGALPDKAEVYSMVQSKTADPDVYADVTKMIDKQYKAVEEAEKQQHRAALDQAYEYLNAGQEIPPSVEANMSAEDIAQIRRGSPDPAIYEDVRARVLRGEEVDLLDYRSRLGGKYDELAELQRNPGKAASGRRIDDVIKYATTSIIGRTTPTSGEDFVKIEQFRRMAEGELDAIRKSTGKEPSTQDAERIVDKLLLTVEVGTFGSDVPFYTVQGGQNYEVDEIPRDRDYFTPEGAPVSYEELIDSLIDFARSNNMPVTPESLQDILEASVDTGDIIRKRPNAP